MAGYFASVPGFIVYICHDRDFLLLTYGIERISLHKHGIVLKRVYISGIHAFKF